MIRPLRIRHRWMIVALTLVAGVLMVLGILARRPIPTVETLPTVGESRGLEDGAGVEK